MPALPEALAAFLAERAEAGLAFETSMATALALATATARRARPTQRPTSSYGVCVADSVDHGRRTPRRQAHPVTVAEVAQIISTIDPRVPSASVTARSSCLATRPLAPRGITALDARDIVTKPTGVLIAVRRSKSDQDARPTHRSGPKRQPPDRSDPRTRCLARDSPRWTRCALHARHASRSRHH